MGLVIVGTERGRDNVLRIADIVRDTFCFTQIQGRRILYGHLIFFVISQCSNRGPLKGDYIVCQGKGSATRRQEQVRGLVGRRKRCSGGGTRRRESFA